MATITHILQKKEGRGTLRTSPDSFSNVNHNEVFNGSVAANDTGGQLPITYALTSAPVTGLTFYSDGTFRYYNPSITVDTIINFTYSATDAFGTVRNESVVLDVKYVTLNPLVNTSGGGNYGIPYNTINRTTSETRDYFNTIGQYDGFRVDASDFNKWSGVSGPVDGYGTGGLKVDGFGSAIAIWPKMQVRTVQPQIYYDIYPTSNNSFTAPDYEIPGIFFRQVNRSIYDGIWNIPIPGGSTVNITESWRYYKFPNPVIAKYVRIVSPPQPLSNWPEDPTMAWTVREFQAVFVGKPA